MFWRIVCKCRISHREPLKIYLLCDTRRIDLGLCAKENDGYGLASRISVKTGLPESFTFFAETHEHKRFFPIEESKPFPALQKLDMAKFSQRNGTPGVLIID